MVKALKGERRMIGLWLVLLAGLLVIVNLIYAFFDLYHRVLWSDVPVHFLFGAWSALTFYYWILGRLPQAIQQSASVFLIMSLAVSWAVFVGVIWEDIEFLHDHFLPLLGLDVRPVQLGNADTMKDLFMDFGGGVVLAFLMRRVIL
jgi:hypothetical protein